MYSDCRLYLISPPALPDLKAFATTLQTTLAAGDVAAFQLRLKNTPQDTSDAAIIQAITTLLPVCHQHDVAFIVNDRPDLAALHQCDGAHVGSKDIPVKKARGLLGSDRMLGASCYDSIHAAMEAAENGADYVAFGSFFPTSTKSGATPASLETLQRWAEMSVIPAVAIGGITVDNCSELVRSGASFLAVSAGVWQYPAGSAAAVAAFNTQIKACLS